MNIRHLPWTIFEEILTTLDTYLTWFIFFSEIFVHAALVFLFILIKKRVSGSVKNKPDEKLIFIHNLITCVPYCEWKWIEIINRWRRKCFPNFQISSIMQWRRYVTLINFIPTPCFVLVLAELIKTDDMIASCFFFSMFLKNPFCSSCCLFNHPKFHHPYLTFVYIN